MAYTSLLLGWIRLCFQIYSIAKALVEENLRIYQGRILLRGILLGLMGLPMLASYLCTHAIFNLMAYDAITASARHPRPKNTNASC